MTTKRELEDQVEARSGVIDVLEREIDNLTAELDVVTDERDTVRGAYHQASIDRDTFFKQRDEWKALAEAREGAHTASEEYIKVLLALLEAQNDEDAEEDAADDLRDRFVRLESSNEARLAEVKRAHELIVNLSFASRVAVPVL